MVHLIGLIYVLGRVVRPHHNHTHTTIKLHSHQPAYREFSWRRRGRGEKGKKEEQKNDDPLLLYYYTTILLPQKAGPTPVQVESNHGFMAPAYRTPTRIILPPITYTPTTDPSTSHDPLSPPPNLLLSHLPLLLILLFFILPFLELNPPWYEAASSVESRDFCHTTYPSIIFSPIYSSAWTHFNNTIFPSPTVSH